MVNLTTAWQRPGGEGDPGERGTRGRGGPGGEGSRGRGGPRAEGGLQTHRPVRGARQGPKRREEKLIRDLTGRCI